MCIVDVISLIKYLHTFMSGDFEINYLQQKKNNAYPLPLLSKLTKRTSIYWCLYIYIYVCKYICGTTFSYIAKQ